ncbi:hotdog fold thioesterase [Shewanella surugensis]|uniref:3-hydroxyacyl-[acyl-carrier-protein] dehydratase FabA n=1 Tax=Shewanella surugensis TaxID=212020 RepID=A0ABT0LHK9_9GAMM|nr:beta-ketoacyl synthase N-terminal-like domain-containing protein [Shewanella surugensis]MCL1127189.1 3-hydroxyacyl-[acyl-carrier-protein] dehydratase FabA [Shewanella surugensis]
MPSHDKEQLNQSSVLLPSQSNRGGKIAIVGWAALYPKAHNVDDFWQNLLHKQDAITALSEQKLRANADDFRGVQGQSDRFYCDKGGYIDKFNFDASGYQLNEEYLLGLDDSMQWSLDTCRKALLNAELNLTPTELMKTGLVMGALSFPTQQSNEVFLPIYHSIIDKALQTRFALKDKQAWTLAPFTPAVNSGPSIDDAVRCNHAKVVAKALGLGGMHFTLDAACASSVYSLKLACDYLTQSKADVMLAAAVSGADPFVVHLGFSVFHAYPDNDVAVPFDRRSQGLFAGEGAGVLVLKRLEDAIRDGNHIQAVIDGVGLSNDGKGYFVLRPKSQGQVTAYERAYHKSGIKPSEVEVIECHATGTPLGDKVELTSMERFFSDKLDNTPAPLIGSVKSNLGHLLTAAGMPGIMKMINAMNTGQLPPSIHSNETMSSPNGLFGKHTLPSEVTDWPDKAGKKNNSLRHAGVSVFGFGGCNAHLLLSSFDEKTWHFTSDTNVEMNHLKQGCLEQKQNTDLPESLSSQDESVSMAIIGLSAHFGPLDSIQAFARAIEHHQPGFIELPTQRWKGLDKHPDILSEFGLNDVPKGAYIEGFELDFLRFKLPPNEDDRLIPQQLLLMKIADEAISDAGLKSGQHVAVLVAMETDLELHQFRGRANLHSQLQQSLLQQGIALSDEEYQALEAMTMDSLLPAAKLNQYTSFIGNIMASRVASLWDFSGPAFTISSVEHSVARCLDVAQNLLADKDEKDPLQAVVIAAVDLSGSVEKVCLTNRIQAVSALKEIKNEDHSNKVHWHVGEGAGAIVVQALDDVNDPLKSYANISELIFNPINAQQVITSDVLSSLSQQISLLESNIAPSRDTHLLHTQLDKLATLLPHAKLIHADELTGHCFAAAGMASLLNGLLQLAPKANDEQTSAAVAAVASINEDEQSVVLLRQTYAQKQRLQQRLTQHLTQSVNTTAPKLIKKVMLGGRDIFEFIMQSPLAYEQNIKQKMQLLNMSVKSSHEESIVSLSNIKETLDIDSQNDVVLSESRQQKKAAGEALTLPLSNVNSRSVAQMNTETMSVENSPLSGSADQGMTLADIVPLHLSQQQLMQDVHLAFLQSRELSQQLRVLQFSQQYGKLNSAEGFKRPHQQVDEKKEPAELLSLDSSDTFDTAEIAMDQERETEAEVTTPYYDRLHDDKPCIWNYDDLREYAEGRIANVFGPEYAIIDSYSRRVRLPTTDYLLVSRVTKLDAKIHEFKPSSMTTEYDIPVDAPYLLDGQILWAVAVESGQCDLMLISYLGIDFENKGERVYRLLDCSLTFLADLPRAGDTLRYDIKINHFARNGDTLLFFFSYECFVDDVMILKMDDGCAGFFTDEELAEGKGVIRSGSEIAVREQALQRPRPTMTPSLDCQKMQFSVDDITQLSQADLVGCFGESHKTKAPLQTSLSFTSKQFLMIEAVSQLDAKGGAWGLGFIEAHKQLSPEHWYFPCHFKDDPVMAGSLMAEGCGQLLQFYMLYLGMHTLTEKGRFQPLEGLTQQVRCRGQVVPQSGQLTYRMEIIEIGFSPIPFAKANVDIVLNGKVVVDFRNLGVVLKEEDKCRRYQGHKHYMLQKKNQSNVNAPLMTQILDVEAKSNKGVIPFKHVPAPVSHDDPNRTPDSLPFTPYHLFEFATGNIEQCFGADFAVYRNRICPRTPCGDLQLTTRVVDIQGTRGDFKHGASCVAEYEVPNDAWYFSQNNHPAKMPYAILMEISLQPNGFISGYMGTTLLFTDEDLFFRNLDGKGTLLREIDLRGKTIMNRSRLISTVIAGSNIIQRFTFELSCDREPFYQGEAAFGYFNQAALTHQLGLDKGKVIQAWHHQEQVVPDHQIDLLDRNSRYFCGTKNQPYFRLAGGKLNFIDQVDIVECGGRQGLGYLFAKRTIDPSDWFFQCHFHQDPVMPGSLGVEAIIELMQVYAINQNLGVGFINPKINHILSDIEWKYRGQINPLNTHMSVDIHITAIRDEAGKKVIVGDANLSKDGLRIYEIKNIAICIEEA